jgi:queuine/archaeosine tRNA-ribosyltransferase
MSIKPSILCRRGHRKTGKNLILRKRVNKKTGKVQVVKECRTCANASLQARREAQKRNARLLGGK